MNVAVVGCGYWGRHIIRNFNNIRQWNLKYVCDINENSLNKIKTNYPNVITTTDYNLLLNDEAIDAIAIATPVDTHFELAKLSLNAGKHTWVEKPLTSNSLQAEELIRIANEKKLLLNVDHTFIYTPAIQKIKKIIQNGDLGDILYFDSIRINLGLFQHDVNVLWDLAPHDISILQYTIGSKPVSVNAVGKCLIDYNGKNIENLAYLTVNFENNLIAHFHVNWISPVKIRHIIIGGSKKMLVFNDMEQISKIKVFDTGVEVNSSDDVYNTLVQYRTGDMYSPAIENKEALEYECEHFYDCIKNNTNTLTPGESGLYVVKILEAANESLKNNGKIIEL